MFQRLIIKIEFWRTKLAAPVASHRIASHRIASELPERNVIGRFQRRRQSYASPASVSRAPSPTAFIASRSSSVSRRSASALPMRPASRR